MIGFNGEVEQIQKSQKLYFPSGPPDGGTWPHQAARGEEQDSSTCSVNKCLGVCTLTGV